MVTGSVAAGSALVLGAASRLVDDLGAPALRVDDGGGGLSRQASCTDAASLLRASAVGRAGLVYEVTGEPSSMSFDGGFHAQLARWLDDWNATSRRGCVRELWSYGAHVNKDGCRSWHAAGRAFDISRLRAGDELLVSCRTDLWDEVSPARRTDVTRAYWTLAASLHLHFAHVLTHHFDSLHANHIHVDNGASGSSMSRFRTGSRVQNQARAGDLSGDLGKAGRGHRTVGGHPSSSGTRAGGAGVVALLDPSGVLAGLPARKRRPRLTPGGAAGDPGIREPGRGIPSAQCGGSAQSGGSCRVFPARGATMIRALRLA